MKLKYKFVCKDLPFNNCNYITYGNRKKDIIKRVQEHLKKEKIFNEKQVNSPEIVQTIKDSIRKSKYVLEYKNDK